MSETTIPPSVDVVKKEWKKDNVITFLRREGLNLDLDEEDIGIIRSKKVSGKDFLGLTTKKLENYGLQPGPASRIAELVKEIKGEQKQGKRSLDDSDDRKSINMKRPRTFAPSNRVHEDINYYIEPKETIEKLGNFLRDGKFCLLYGHRQSGKSTIAYAIEE